jgi:hypothetical protein
MNLDGIELAGAHHVPDPDMTGDGYRRLAGQWTELARAAGAIGDPFKVAEHHRGEADRNIALGLRADAERFEADRIAARKAQTNEFLGVIGAKLP